MTALSEEQTTWARRVLALLVDWLASILVVILVLGIGGWSENKFSGLYTLGVFVVESTMLTALAGGSFGKLATRLRVVRTDGSGRPPAVLLALLRQVLVAVVIPPLVYRPDGRGLHDLAAGTTTVELRPSG